jgi:putative transposase
MTYDPEEHHRRSIRLQHYDYSTAGAYFITICTHKLQCILGHVADGEMKLNEYGIIAENEWIRTATLRSNLMLEQYVIMPNHLHGIIIIMQDLKGVSQYAPTKEFRSPEKTIGAIIRGFKSATTKQINKMRLTPGIPAWQRNYYEHIIRDENDLNKIREYIMNNPITWELDDENPENIKRVPHRLASTY